MAYVLGPARERGLHIWSRMQRGDKRYRFPRSYRKHVVGSLPYERMLAAYTSYKVFLNVNSVTRSKTMCSRRLFELSAAQTAVVSAPAASIEPFFGATIEVVENAEETGRALDVLLSNAEYRDRLALQAHRRVFDEHLYSHRVDAVLRSVGLAGRRGPSDPGGERDRPDQAPRAAGPRAGDHRQAVAPRASSWSWSPTASPSTPRRSTGSTSSWSRPHADLTLGACMNLGVEAATGDLVAKVDDDNFYGTHYLTDLVRALDYSGADVVGKWAHLVHLESSGATLLRFEKAEHRFVEQVQGGTLLMRRTVAERIRFEDLPRRVDTTFLAKVRAAGLTVYAADRFNFVSVRRADTGSHTWPISDKEIMARSSRLLFYGDPTSHAEA